MEDQIKKEIQGLKLKLKEGKGVVMTINEALDKYAQIIDNPNATTHLYTKDDQTLCALEIHNLIENKSGFCAATLVGTEENIIIFRGTAIDNEWTEIERLAV